MDKEIDVGDTREVLELIVAAKGVMEIREITNRQSGEMSQWINRLVICGWKEWSEMRGKLDSEEPELALLAQRARERAQEILAERLVGEPFDFSTSIVGLEAAPFIGLKNRRPLIRLIFKNREGRALVTDQDIEDTLWIAAGILEVVADAVVEVSEGLGVRWEHVQWGEEFESNLNSMLQSARRLTDARGRQIKDSQND